MKDSFVGSCKTIMIAAISPSIIQYEDTKNTLKYAKWAMNIETEVKALDMLRRAETLENQNNQNFSWEEMMKIIE